MIQHILYITKNINHTLYFVEFLISKIILYYEKQCKNGCIHMKIDIHIDIQKQKSLQQPKIQS